MGTCITPDLPDRSKEDTMNTVAPTHLAPAVIGPADLELPPTQPIDITELLRTPTAQ